ncbi:MAG: hypothetical protein BKP49_02770 [Treponema sp. CETP13]|nr:MAG: hypothetical protein BKP49_02770 [Treponema sp. CETP13]
MKKIYTVILIILCSVSVFAASYTNNPYQKLAREYNAKSEQAFDEGNYDASVEYAELAEQNAALSENYTEMMVAKYSANTRLKYAANRLAWADSIKASVFYPMAYTASKTAYENGQTAFSEESYAQAEDFANQSIQALADVKEVIPLPEYYVVKPWESDKDCFWNISGRSYIYNNPLLWENLYEANKDNIPESDNPDLIYPGMKMKIPSISGEYREGIYSSTKDYEAFSSNK